VATFADRLEALDTCVVSDAMESFGYVGALGGIRPMWDCDRVAGPARTVQLAPVEPGETPPPGPHLGARTIESGAPGDVVVVAHGGREDSAGWGGLLSAAAQAAGLRGCLVDGACRDVDDAKNLAFPLFARSATPLTARGRTVEAAFEVAVQIGDVTVSPGDLVAADRTGVVVVPFGRAEEIISRAEDMAKQEQAMLDSLRAGVSVTHVMGRRYESMVETPT
jgi:4-hydroxy-4-methyl-2-oxoglutarate aldolase